MDLTELEHYLYQAVSPERADILLQAMSVLQDIEYSSHLYPIKESLMGFDDADPGTIVSHVAEILLEALKTALRSSSIRIRHDVEEKDIPVLSNIIVALSTATSTLDSTNLLSFLERDESPEELLAEMVSLVTPIPIEVVLDVVESFREDMLEMLLSNFKEECELREDSMITHHEIMRERRQFVVNRLRLYMRRYNPSFAKRLVTSGFELGLPEGDVYAAVAEDILLEENGQRFVEEFIGIMLLTDQSVPDILENTRLSIEEINFPDPSEKSKAFIWLAAHNDTISHLLSGGE